MIGYKGFRHLSSQMIFIFVVLLVMLGTAPTFAQSDAEDVTDVTETTEVTERRLKVSEYRQKMMAGWIGQMVGVGWGGPTEFRWANKIIPEDSGALWQASKNVPEDSGAIRQVSKNVPEDSGAL